MFDIHEKPMPTDDFIEMSAFHYFEIDDREEEDEYLDGYPDELIPLHAFTSEEEQNVA
jgi:hypothetical protein